MRVGARVAVAVAAAAALLGTASAGATTAGVGAGAAAPALGREWAITPSPTEAAHDEPVTYRNGCHAKKGVIAPKACLVVNPGAARSVMLFGDSHANHWYTAVVAAARANGWRMVHLTKSSCPAADVAVDQYMSTEPYPACSTWRKAALPQIAAKRWGPVDVVLVSNWHHHRVLASPYGRRLTGDERTKAWRAGMTRTLRALLQGARQVVLVRDSPDLPGDIHVAQACYARWGKAMNSHCGAPASQALSASIWRAERQAAAAFPGRVTLLDLSTPYCRNGWCGPLDAPYLAFKDDNHWTQTYVRARLAAPIRAALGAAMRRAAP